MHVRRIFAALGGLVVLLGLMASPAVADETATVNGTVTWPNGDPIAGVTVNLVRWPTDGESEPRPIQRHKSDAAGKVTFEVPLDGSSFSLEANSKAEFRQRYAGTEVFELSPGQTVDKAVIVKRAGVLTGRVVDGDGNSAAGVIVVPLSDDVFGTGYVVTDQNGVFRSTQLPPGAYTLMYETDGDDSGQAGLVECYHEIEPTLDWLEGPDDDYSASCDAGDTVDVRARKVTEVEQQTFGGDTATVRAKAVDSSGAPLADQQVQLWGTRATGETVSVATGTTNAGGLAVFKDVDILAVEYYLEVTPTSPSHVVSRSSRFDLDDGDKVTKRVRVRSAGS